ncbi:nucleotidyltransferase family protein [Nocardioides carbamazepini]|uniref:nucleotidyltransferase family protein n=1 Tax=Nocardioides carbamazepini TaxID=2854259 RepID=UPI00214A04B0|nr:nucleotidyltransferase family protein [Nocardioides carbamazepini]MCR1784052.1 nucleotidyltransferase family protein [Nocardioides carbamazepini]
MTADVLDLLCRLARSALDAEEGHGVEPVRIGEASAGDLLDGVRRHRVPELIHAHAGELGLSGEVVRILGAMVDGSRPRRMVHAFETVRAWQLLDAAGVDALVVKGIPLAVLTTGRPGSRGAGDIDVLVRPGAAEEAHRLLSGAGWALHEQCRIEPGMWAWRHVQRWGHTLTYLGSGADVDLHWRLDAMPGAQPDPAVLMERRTTVEVGGVQVPTLAPADAFRHLAGHREGWIWLRTLVDLRRLARDPEVFAQELPAPALASLAAARATVGLPDTVPGRVLAALDRVPDAVLARARARHRQPVAPWGGASTARDFRDGLASSTGPRDLQQLAVGLVLPPHAALPVRSATAWGGVPRAFALRAQRLVRR